MDESWINGGALPHPHPILSSNLMSSDRGWTGAIPNGGLQAYAVNVLKTDRVATHEDQVWISHHHGRGQALASVSFQHFGVCEGTSFQSSVCTIFRATFSIICCFALAYTSFCFVRSLLSHCIVLRRFKKADKSKVYIIGIKTEYPGILLSSFNRSVCNILTLVLVFDNLLPNIHPKTAIRSPLQNVERLAHAQLALQRLERIGGLIQALHIANECRRDAPLPLLCLVVFLTFLRIL